MKFLIYLFFVANLFSQETYNNYFNLSVSEKMRFKQGGRFHFIGIDPDSSSIPNFQISTKNLIDTVYKNYTSSLRAQIPLNQLKVKLENSQARFNFSIKFEVLNNNRQVFSKNVTKSLSIQESKYKNFLFEKYTEDIKEKFENGEYKLVVTLNDLNSNMSNKQETEFIVKSYYRDKLLISDLRFYDSVTGNEVKTKQNALYSNEGDIIVKFDSYKKNTKFQFLYDVEVREEKKASQKIIDFFTRDLFLAFLKIDYFFTNEKDTSDLSFDTILFDDDKAYNSFEFRIMKSEFRDFNFFEVNYGQRYMNIFVRPKIQVMNTTRSKISESDILSINDMTDSNFFDKTINSDIDEVIIVDTKELFSSKFTRSEEHTSELQSRL